MIQRRCSQRFVAALSRLSAVENGFATNSVPSSPPRMTCTGALRQDNHGADCPIDDKAVELMSSSRRHAGSLSHKDEKVFHYKGPLSTPIKNLKKLSLAGCCVSIVGAPIMVFGAADQMPLIAQITISSTVAGFGIFTTGLLHWFTSPYVHRLNYDKGSQICEAETLSLFARPQLSSFRDSDVKYPETLRPQVTFQVQDKFFYLDADHFQDEALLAKLTPPDPNGIAVPEKQALQDQ